MSQIRSSVTLACVDGYFGDFGGTYVPELLMPNLLELQENYLRIIDSDEFLIKFRQELKHYVNRPSSLYFAENLSKLYGARIYLKREDLNHTLSHKINNTIGQAIIAKLLGKTEIIAETGAGQHGVATATVCAKFGLKCRIFMGAKDIARQKQNVMKMRLLGAELESVTSGSQSLKDSTNEAMRHWIKNPSSHYIIGSAIGPHPYPDMVSRLQSVISQELLEQVPEQTDQGLPDYVIACVGGGSNAIGAFYHFLDSPEVKLIGVEAAGKGVDTDKTAATLTCGRSGVLHGSRTIILQSPEGQIHEAHSVSAGLDYPGIGPVHAYLHNIGRVKFYSVTDDEALGAVEVIAKNEGIIPALESMHAFACLPKISFKPRDVVVVCLSGDGGKDLPTYEDFYQFD